jgi:RNA-binding protein
MSHKPKRKTKEKAKAGSAGAAEAGPPPTQTPLTSAERKKLRGLAHALHPLVSVGRSGLTGGALREIDRALAIHELVKVRLVAEREERRAMAEAIGEKLRCGVAGTIGQIAVLYRQHLDPEARRVELGRDLYASG